MERFMHLDWAFRSLRLRGVLLLALSLATLKAQDFVAIFDGKTLSGWDGDPKLWRVENGAIVGQTTPTTLPRQNSFLIWRGGRPANFEL